MKCQTYQNHACFCSNCQGSISSLHYLHVSRQYCYPGYPVVKLTSAFSDVLSEAEKAGRDLVLEIGETHRLKVTHVESPKEVYFMQSSDIESFWEFQNILLSSALIFAYIIYIFASCLKRPLKKECFRWLESPCLRLIQTFSGCPMIII